MLWRFLPTREDVLAGSNLVGLRTQVPPHARGCTRYQVGLLPVSIGSFTVQGCPVAPLPVIAASTRFLRTRGCIGRISLRPGGLFFPARRDASTLLTCVVSGKEAAPCGRMDASEPLAYPGLEGFFRARMDASETPFRLLHEVPPRAHGCTARQELRVEPRLGSSARAWMHQAARRPSALGQ